MLGPGTSVFVKGRLGEVLRLAPNGDVLVKLESTLELHWYDYYACQVIDLDENPGAVLEALATLRSREKEVDPDAT